MVTTLAVEQGQIGPNRISERSEDLAKRFGGLVAVDYLMELFQNSPKEFFSRLDVLTVLDAVRRDTALFPEAVVRVSARIKASRRARGLSVPENLTTRAGA